MHLNIKHYQEESKIVINFNKETLEIFIKEEDQTKNQDWNTNGINNFLIKLSSELPEEEDIKVRFDWNNKNPIYKHIVNLFQSFAKTYLESIV